jgi:hypothetical protein
MAEPLDIKEIKVRTLDEAITPDLSSLKTLSDIHKIGIDDLDTLSVKSGRLTNGNLNLSLRVPQLDKTISKSVITEAMKNILFSGAPSTDWTPVGGEWKDQGDYFKDVTEYNDPIQGAVANCYFIAALAAVAWSDPYSIVHRVRATSTS